MSTDFRALTTIEVNILFDGRLERFGVHEYFPVQKSDLASRVLSDGSDFLYVYRGVDNVSVFTAYGLNNPARILEAIEQALGTEIVSEHNARFWGFDTWDSWTAALSRMAKDEADQFYGELLKHLRGEPNEIKTSTGEMARAEIAAKLVADDPGLLLLENRLRLEEAIEMTWNQQIHSDIPF
jgi:hypothetical protein